RGRAGRVAGGARPGGAVLRVGPAPRPVRVGRDLYDRAAAPARRPDAAPPHPSVPAPGAGGLEPRPRARGLLRARARRGGRGARVPSARRRGPDGVARRRAGGGVRPRHARAAPGAIAFGLTTATSTTIGPASGQQRANT